MYFFDQNNAETDWDAKNVSCICHRLSLLMRYLSLLENDDKAQEVVDLQGKPRVPGDVALNGVLGLKLKEDGFSV